MIEYADSATPLDYNEIHPFSNGNGRHARLMADLILEKLFTAEVFSWNGKSLANHNKSREEYVKACTIFFNYLTLLFDIKYVIINCNSEN